MQVTKLYVKKCLKILVKKILFHLSGLPVHYLYQQIKHILYTERSIKHIRLFFVFNNAVIQNLIFEFFNTYLH